MRRLLFGALGAGALLLAACNTGGGSVTNPGPCGPPVGSSVVLVYPAPGATAVPDNFGLVVLGSTTTLPTSYQAYVYNTTTNNGFLFNAVSIPPNPLPTPNATPSFANPIYQASGNPGTTFVAGSTINVYLNNANSTCVPQNSLGSFTVQ
jgi:hypothetical protein